ncbi:MAG: acyl--CoA ligase [Ruminococcus sp.]|nr:acyl--CoA ligase [Ruminococcus sp.]
MNAREYFRPFTDPEEFERIVEKETVTGMWRDCLRDYAEREAIVFRDTAYTYEELERDAAAFRAVLLQQIDSGRVGILCANSYDFVKAFVAVTTLGMTAVILPAHLDARSVFGCCMRFQLDALVYQPELDSQLDVVREKLDDLPIIDITAETLDSAEMRDCDAKTPCVMMFTGGTTGKSKCALLSNGAVLQGTVNGCYGVWNVFYQRYLLILPLSHVFGLIRNLMTSLYTGSTLLICDNNKNMFRDIRSFKPTVLVMVPALAEMSLSLSKQFGKNMLGDDLKTIICGAAAVAPYLIEEYDKLGIKLLQGYGLTESANLVSGNPLSVEHPDSIGYPYPNQELKIVEGELWLRGKNMMDGYVGGDENGYDADGWFHTGDLVRQDENGLLYITGRIKEIIVLSNGENISPAELEGHFNALPFIQDSQVFEAVTDGGRHILALEVVPRQTVLQKIKAEDPKRFILGELEKVNQSLPSFQRVTRITVRDSDFERSPSMKIVRYKNDKK